MFNRFRKVYCADSVINVISTFNVLYFQVYFEDGPSLCLVQHFCLFLHCAFLQAFAAIF